MLATFCGCYGFQHASEPAKINYVYANNFRLLIKNKQMGKIQEK